VTHAQAPHRGDVHWAVVEPHGGHEQGGRRPVLIFQHDRVSRWASTIIIIPLTTSLRFANLPTNVHIPAGAAGLQQEGLALCHQLRVLDKQRIGARIGALPQHLLAEIEDVVLSTLGIVV
jgi:mRNA interferase MazF